ncbi:MAG: phosphoribosylamine--glycine ligase [Tepidisphaeraceae bacterium]
MNVALIGNGGREHALAWKLAQSKGLDRLFVIPGNPGTHEEAENVAIDPADIAKVVKFCTQNKVELAVIGPEDPLAAGIVDALAKEKIRAFGPNKEAARLEADKWFAKELMRQQAVPTAEARSFTSYNTAVEYVSQRGAPLVIKATGLAKGKGVTVAYRTEDALEALEQIMKQKVFGDAGARVVVEEMLTGPEVSAMALVDGKSIYVLDPCQDHKQVDDGNTGPMTGGMGAFCPTPTLTPELLSIVEREVFIPVLDGLRRDGIDYKGVLYAGLMLTTGGPKVLEFNVRFGDPETQPLMMRLKSDLLDVINAVVDGKLDEVSLDWDARPSLCVVATSKGYPGKYETGKIITGIKDADALPDTKVFHSGTAQGRTHGHPWRPGTGCHHARRHDGSRARTRLCGHGENSLRRNALPQGHRGTNGVKRVLRFG